MAQQLRAPTVLVDPPGLILSTDTEWLTTTNSFSSKDLTSSSGLLRHLCVLVTYIYSHTLKKIPTKERKIR